MAMMCRHFGLGQSLDREIDLVTHYYAFLFDRLGIAYRGLPQS